MKTLLDFFLLFLMLSSILVQSEARHLKVRGFAPNAAKACCCPSLSEGHKSINSDKLIGVKKSGHFRTNSGLSPGTRHWLADAETLGGIKDFGPSHGEGHKLLGGIKDTDASPGDGHKYVNGKTFGGIKDSGPSPGTGTEYANAKTLGGIKDSGPCPGDRHGCAKNSKTPGGATDSGASPGTGHHFVTHSGPSPGEGH